MANRISSVFGLSECVAGTAVEFLWKRMVDTLQWHHRKSRRTNSFLVSSSDGKPGVSSLPRPAVREFCSLSPLSSWNFVGISGLFLFGASPSKVSPGRLVKRGLARHFLPGSFAVAYNPGLYKGSSWPLSLISNWIFLYDH